MDLTPCPSQRVWNGNRICGIFKKNKKIRDWSLKGPLVGQKVHLKLPSLVSSVPVAEPTEQEVERTHTMAGSDNGTFIGFLFAMFGVWGVYKITGENPY